MSDQAQAGRLMTFGEYAPQCAVAAEKWMENHPQDQGKDWSDTYALVRTLRNCIQRGIDHLQRETDPVPHGCEVIKFARAGEKSNKLFSAHIFPEDQILTVEVRAYNGDAQPMAGDHIPRSEYEKYDPFLVFEFYQKDSVVSLRDTCNWIIDTLEEKEKDTATEPKGEPHD